MYKIKKDQLEGEERSEDQGERNIGDVALFAKFRQEERRVN